MNLFSEEGRTGDVKELFDFTRKIFRWRKTKEVIHKGKTLHFVDREHNTYAFFRYTDEEAVFVFANNSRGKKQVPWSHYEEIASTLKGGRNVLTGEAVEMNDQTTVPARGVLVVEFERSIN